MKKYIRVGFRITEQQKKILEAKARSQGYAKLASYIRSTLFRSLTVEEKIDAIYKEVCNE